MSTHGIKVARYTTDNLAFVKVTRTDGREEYRHADDDIDGGGMLAFLAEGGVIEPFEPPVPTAGDFAAAIQLHVDNTARGREYADGFALSSYVTSNVEAWAAEAKTFIAWRDAVWLTAYQVLADVQSGQRATPTISALVAELPAIDWGNG